MEINTLNTSIAATLNIEGIYYNENIIVTLKNNDSPWRGQYTFSLFDSKHKSTQIHIENCFSVTANQMLIVINPKSQKLYYQEYYYEILNTTSQRVEFVGHIKIVK